LQPGPEAHRRRPNYRNRARDQVGRVGPSSRTALAEPTPDRDLKSLWDNPTPRVRSVQPSVAETMASPAAVADSRRQKEGQTGERFRPKMETRTGPDIPFQMAPPYKATEAVHQMANHPLPKMAGKMIRGIGRVGPAEMAPVAGEPERREGRQKRVPTRNRQTAAGSHAVAVLRSVFPAFRSFCG
jgi:hypothetical protein